MFPLKDANPTSRLAIVTIALIAINVAVYFWVQPNGSSPDRLEQSTKFTYEHAAIPCEVTTNQPVSAVEITTGTCNKLPEGPPVFPHKSIWLSILVSMFLHGSIVHIGGNMLFLWIFGNNVEDRLGRLQYLAFYLIGGVIATMSYILVNSGSTVPTLGASGAIAAVMGCYLVWFPNVRIRTLFFFGIVLFRDITAKWLLLLWFASQFLDVINPNSGVAWMAHVGGFLFGIAVGLLMRSRAAPAPALRGSY